MPTSATWGHSGHRNPRESLATPSSFEQSLVTLESDKATMRCRPTAAGVVKEVKVKLGDKVPKARSLSSSNCRCRVRWRPVAAPAPAPAPAAWASASPAPSPG